MKLYIAGPMTGLPDFNYPAFDAAEQQLQAAGYETLNPARRGVVEGKPWEDYLREALADVCAADGVALLPGHQNSRGVALERHVAEALGLDVRGIGRWLAPVAEDAVQPEAPEQPVVDATWALTTPNLWESPNARSIPTLLAAIGQVLAATEGREARLGQRLIYTAPPVVTEPRRVCDPEETSDEHR